MRIGEEDEYGDPINDRDATIRRELRNGLLRAGHQIEQLEAEIRDKDAASATLSEHYNHHRSRARRYRIATAALFLTVLAGIVVMITTPHDSDESTPVTWALGHLSLRMTVPDPVPHPRS